MNKETAKQLLRKVKEDYDKIADEFDKTRQHDWKEFELFLEYIKNRQKIADLGCGNGRFYNFIKNHKKINYIGIDNNEKLLRKCQIKYKNEKLAKFIDGDLLKIPLKKSSVNITLAIASFHHLPSLALRQKSLQEIHRILKNNGIFIISVWNLFQPKYKKHIWRARIRRILSFGKYDWRDTLIPWGKSGINRYYYAFKAKELEKLLTENGFKIIEKFIGNNLVFICKKE